jgi:hypothetical protein
MNGHLIITGVTANAIRQRVQKIKNNAKLVIADSSMELKVNSKDSVGTPKRQAPGSSKKASSAKPSDESNDSSPTKKAKVANSKVSKVNSHISKVKIEPEVEEDEVNKGEDNGKSTDPDVDGEEAARMLYDGVDEEKAGV